MTVNPAIAELFFLSDRSDHSDHVETRLYVYSERIPFIIACQLR